MSWTVPAFEEIKMDAEARSYGMWVSDLEARPEAQEAAAPEADTADE